jgi:signal transduction histidine kinase
LNPGPALASAVLTPDYGARMRKWLRAPAFDDAEKTRQAGLLFRLVRAMTLLVVVGAGASIFDARNDIRVTVPFYGVVLAWLASVLACVRRGRVVLAAWVFSLFFWGLIAFVTLVFGGLQGQNASLFAVCTLLIGSIVGGRAALFMAVASSVWCGVVAYLEAEARLPPQLGPYAPGNAWAAVTITVLLTTVLLHTSLESLRRVHEEAARAATQRDEALRRSIQGQKMELVGNLTSGIAHDLNNLLTVIVGASDVLRTQVAGQNVSALGLLDELEGAASRASLMTRQLLSFGQVRSTEKEYIDFGATLDGMSKMLPRLLGHALSIEVSAERGCWVHASRSGLEQILLNLAVNARDAMPEGGSFRLDVRLEETEVVLSARDTGVGMTREVREQAFEPFFTTKATGTGLGLATVRQLVDHYGGSIALQTEPGAGTLFTLRFPLASAGRSRATSAPSLPPPVDGSDGVPPTRVLLVEDDPLVRKALARALEKAGHEVVAVADGVEALAALEELDVVHCIVSDVAMPNMDGEALARHVAESRPELPMVLISGNREPSGALSPELPRTFLLKPVGSEELGRAVRRVMQWKTRRR